ncbi:MAG TPA: 2-amino-4-hydroxy-6-hydroxymethyldihydropteridine diphosphokinase [Eubacteriaceae bacterium]|nr:2-amino-4-hydroxy-6-hydroxymethyldihydropteridine diphosphokinase [Eubacteriaceae bacterium]
MKDIYLSLGSNVGDTKKNIEEALKMLSEKIDIIKVSSFYETEPVGYADQDWFLNIVLKAKTDLVPLELLEFCKGIESKMKRVKTVRFGPRVIDVDILLYQDFSSDEDVLTVPHPRMKQRAFVIVPLFEIEQDLKVGDMHIKEIINKLQGEQIRKLGD